MNLFDDYEVFVFDLDGILRLVTLWFDFGGRSCVNGVFQGRSRISHTPCLSQKKGRAEAGATPLQRNQTAGRVLD